MGGRSKSATVARRLLDRKPAAGQFRPATGAWPADALADALTARIGRADRPPAEAEVAWA